MAGNGFNLGYLAVNEVVEPAGIIKNAQVAEKAGFDTVWVSDHFHPWSNAGTNCNFCWTIMTAIAERTSKIRIGPGVTVPFYRYHPGIIAQAFATLGVMYPGRIFLGIGSGEPINEVALGSDWPRVPQRLEKFDEALKVIRSLFDDEFVTLEGKHFTLRSANLYTKPRKPVPIYVSTSGPKSATIAGRYGDGIIIPNGVEAPVQLMRERIMPAFKKGAEEAGRDPSAVKVAVLATVAYAEDADKILAGKAKEYWNHTVLSDLMEEPVYDPRINERKGKSVDDQAFRARWIVETSIDAHIRRLEPFAKMGIDELVILSTSPDEEKFLRVYGSKVIPYLREVANKEKKGQ